MARVKARGTGAERLSPAHTACLALEARTGSEPVPVLALDGELDFDVVPLIDRFLRRALGPLYHRQHLVIDLAGATFVDSSFIGFVVRLSGQQRAQRKEVVLARASSQVGRALSLVGLPNVVPVFETVDDAVDALSRARGPVIPPAAGAAVRSRGVGRGARA